MTNLYHLEIYEDDDRVVSGHYTSETPFLSIHIGEVISAASMNGTNEKKNILIKDIQHIFWEVGGNFNHKICVYGVPIVG